MKTNKITYLQYSTLLFFLLNSFLLNIGYYTLTITSFTDSILDILFGGAFILLFGFLYFKIIYQEKDNFITTCFQKLPKMVTVLLFIVLTVFIGFICIYSLRVLTSFIHYYILKDVAWLTILITLILTVLYVVSKNLSTIGRMSELFFYVYVLIFIVGILGGIQYFDFTNVKPLFSNSFSSHLLSSGFYFLSSIVPFFFLSVIGKKNIEKENKNRSMRLPFLFMILSILFTFIQLLTIILVLGIQLTNLYQIPEMIVYKKISFLNVLERIEVLLAFNHFLNSFFLITLGTYYLKEMGSFFLKKKKEPIILALIGILFIVCSNFIPKEVSLYLLVSNILLVLIVFILLFLLYKYIHYQKDNRKVQ